jgi:hypothetical protein
MCISSQSFTQVAHQGLYVIVDTHDRTNTRLGFYGKVFLFPRKVCYGWGKGGWDHTILRPGQGC